MVRAASQPKPSARLLLHPLAKPALLLCGLLPLAWLIYDAFTGGLGPNAPETVIRTTGDWTLRFLCFTLAVTPLRQWASLPALLRFRRTLGLFAFFYGCMHFASYGWLDMEFVLADIGRDIVKRPFILVGSLALVLMVPLALTSFNRAIRALGGKRWQTLHRLTYAVAMLGLLHFFWMRAAKNNLAEVAIYAAVIAVLLGWRVFKRLRRKPG